MVLAKNISVAVVLLKVHFDSNTKARCSCLNTALCFPLFSQCAVECDSHAEAEGVLKMAASDRLAYSFQQSWNFSNISFCSSVCVAGSEEDLRAIQGVRALGCVRTLGCGCKAANGGIPFRRFSLWGARLVLNFAGYMCSRV